MKERIAIIAGARTPMGKAGGKLKNIHAADLGALALRETIERSGLADDEIDEVIIGNVAQPANSANIARIVLLKAGLPISTPAYTVHRNCASGMEAITSGAEKILTGNANIVLAGGAESMSGTPLIYNKRMTNLFADLSNRKNGILAKLRSLTSFRLNFLQPVVGIVEGLTDPVCGLNMGQTAEVLAKEFKISREEQDAFALASHKKAAQAAKEEIFKEEIFPVLLNEKTGEWLAQDESVRADQSLSKLAKLKPYFDRRNGTVTAANACPISDGAAAVVLMRESEAKKRKLTPLGYLQAYAYASLEPERMGLGPAYATAKLMKKVPGLSLRRIDIIEMNEAFAAQVIANLHAFSSSSFAEKYLGRKTALGEIDEKKLNVNGGAIAAGHPVGMTGTRLVLHTLLELRRRNKNTGLATLCIGGGQGAALLLSKK